MPDDRELLPLRELARHIPNRVNYESVRRWCTRGLKGQRGEIVKMKSIRLTSGRYSKLAWYAKFIRELNGTEIE